MGSYVKYSEEQKEAANSVLISDILDREGEKYKKWGRQFQWLRHDSVIFSGSKWFRYSEGEGGRAIGFCMKFFAKSFQEAMEYLLDFYPWVVREKTLKNLSAKFDDSERKNADRLSEIPDESEKNFAENESREASEFSENLLTNLQLPAANPTMKNVYRYLIKERCVDPTVVSFFARNGLIYEEKAWHGVVFLGRDSEGKVRNAHVRGTWDGRYGKEVQQDRGVRKEETLENESGESGARHDKASAPKSGKFRMTVEGSDPNYGFGHVGTGNALYAFEAPIDLLSFVSMYPKDWQKNSYVALNGVGDSAILRFLKEHSNVSSVVLCLDNDQAGEKACKRITEDLTAAGVADVRRLTSHWKDWNEDLLKLKNSIGEECGAFDEQTLIGNGCMGADDCQKEGAVWDQSLF